MAVGDCEKEGVTMGEQSWTEERSGALLRRPLRIRAILAKLIVGLLGELEDVVRDGHDALVVFVKGGEKVVRVDAGAGSVRCKRCNRCRSTRMR